MTGPRCCVVSFVLLAARASMTGEMTCVPMLVGGTAGMLEIPAV